MRRRSLLTAVVGFLVGLFAPKKANADKPDVLPPPYYTGRNRRITLCRDRFDGSTDIYVTTIDGASYRIAMDDIIDRLEQEQKVPSHIRRLRFACTLGASIPDQAIDPSQIENCFGPTEHPVGRPEAGWHRYKSQEPVTSGLIRRPKYFRTMAELQVGTIDEIVEGFRQNLITAALAAFPKNLPDDTPTCSYDNAMQYQNQTALERGKPERYHIT